MNGPIVVGTDGSETATVAVQAATTLAKTFGQPLHVVCAYSVHSAADGMALAAGVSAPVLDGGWVEAVLSAAAEQIEALERRRPHARDSRERG